MGKSKVQELKEHLEDNPRSKATQILVEEYGFKWKTRKSFAKPDLELLAVIAVTDVNTAPRLADSSEMDIKGVRRRLQRMTKREWIKPNKWEEYIITDAGKAILAKRDSDGCVAPEPGEKVDDEAEDTAAENASLDDKVQGALDDGDVPQGDTPEYQPGMSAEG